MSRSGSYNYQSRGIRQLPYHTAPSVKRYASISVILPKNRSVDVYVNGSLLKSNAYSTFEMVTPNLAPGTYKYTLLLRDTSDPTKVWKYDLKGIVAGKTLQFDLSTLS